MTFATVKVFPEPVTPRRVWWREPERIDFFSFEMAMLVFLVLVF